MSTESMTLKLKVWRQANAADQGRFEEYTLTGVTEDSSFLEMLDLLNEQLVAGGKPAIAFDSDCREGICGMCSLVINGRPHGPRDQTTACQLHMRNFKDGDTITIEPWRAKPFPVIADLVVDRSALDKIIQSGGFISVNTGAPADANAILIPKRDADFSMDAAACIGCGACVAACPNASAMLFVSGKISQLALLPQGQAERYTRVKDMIAQMDAEEFGTCTNHGECEAACPKGVSLEHIARMNRDFLKASLLGRR